MQDRKRVQADLNWLKTSPDFLSVLSMNRLHKVELFNASELLCNTSINSDDFVFEPTHRLGVYFEQLWHHLIRSNPDLKLVSYNQQVIINKHTLGEFDSVIKLLTMKQTLHCELAVKFYLQIGSGNTMSDWVGPNLRDRFDRKFHRLMSHQLALSNKTEIQRWLAENELTIDEVGLLTRGRLFYCLDHFLDQQFEFPAEVEVNHLKGFWAGHQQFQTYRKQTDYDWYQLPRMYWLSELTTNDLEQVNTASQLSENQLVKVVAMKEGKEVMRGFVVTDEWLERARARILTTE